MNVHSFSGIGLSCQAENRRSLKFYTQLTNGGGLSGATGAGRMRLKTIAAKMD
jgi:hypothetical protein